LKYTYRITDMKTRTVNSENVGKDCTLWTRSRDSPWSQYVFHLWVYSCPTVA